jgi:CPA1 family monovalent cation:H+ antiporter
MDHEQALEAMRFFVLLITLAAIVALVVRRIAVPYTVALVVLGLLAAALIPPRGFSVSPDLVLLVLLPGLVFEAAIRLEFGQLRRIFGGIALLAVPGVLVTVVIVAVILNLTTGLPMELGFVVGSMVAATDPAAVIATFRQAGSPRQLATLVEGESLFNDGTALVVFALALSNVTAQPSLLDGLVSITIVVVASMVIGGVAGFVASRIIATVDDHLIELTVSLAAAYGTYMLADTLHESGVIATVVAGVVIGNYGRQIGMSSRTAEALDTVWEFVAFLLTALVFLLVGLAISIDQLEQALPTIVWGIIAVLVGRVVVVYGLLGGVSRFSRLGGRQRTVPLAWLHVMFWAGLRGAVAVAMALSLPLDFPQREVLQEVTFGVVLFTLFVQGSTVELLIERVGAGRHDPDAKSAPAA